MKFFDKVEILAQSGDGGDGVVAGRREKHVPFGGPAGGDGGKGGSLIFVGSENEWTLMSYRYKVSYKAPPGEPGGSSQKYGRDAEDLILVVPVGTVIRDAETGEVLAQILAHEQQYEALKGGVGGIGNMHFTTAQNQYPQMALYGEPGHKKKLILELQMLADVALIGTPSVGKSTLINFVSNVKAKTAQYHFTTLVPNLGVVQHKQKSFTLIDIPGLIQGASDGKGLGNAFLRHVMKSRILTFLIDGSRFEQGWDDFAKLLDEIFQFFIQEYADMLQHEVSLELKERDGKVYLELSKVSDETGKEEPLVVKAIQRVINKQDMMGDEEVVQEYTQEWYKTCQKQLGDRGLELNLSCIENHTSVLSAATGNGIDTWLDSTMYLISDERLTSEIQIDTLQTLEEKDAYLIDITYEALDFLKENNYLSSGEYESQKSLEKRTEDEEKARKLEEAGKKKKKREPKDWEVYHPEMSYLTFVLPWGNDEAELWFRRELQKRSVMKRFEQAGVKKGDIFKIISPYHGIDDRRVMRD